MKNIHTNYLLVNDLKIISVIEIILHSNEQFKDIMSVEQSD